MKKFILATMMVLGLASMASAQSVTDGKSYFSLSGGQVRASGDDRGAYGVVGLKLKFSVIELVVLP